MYRPESGIAAGFLIALMQQPDADTRRNGHAADARHRGEILRQLLM
jgi:hypothetical protein